MRQPPRHIVLVSIDTLRADCIKASPRAENYLVHYDLHTKLETSALDDLLRSSVYFNNCYSAAPYTSAAHAAYFTGKWPLRNGVYEFFNKRLTAPTIFEIAKSFGYTTIFQTDFPVILGSALGFSKGVDHYYIEDETAALELLKSKVKEPTLSFFHFGGVHYPYGFHSLKFGGAAYINKVKLLEEQYLSPGDRAGQPEDILDETFRNKADMELLLRYKYVIQKLYAAGKYNELFELYLEGINFFLRSRFEPFISQLRKFVDDHNAILFVFADHGENWDARSEGHHNSLSDGVLRVPLMAYGSDISPRIDNHLVRTIDLAPTLISFLAKDIEKFDFDGIPLNLNRAPTGSNALAYAISQVWTSKASKLQIVNYQKALVEKSSSPPPLDTYLSGEVCRTIEQKLALYYLEDGTLDFVETASDSFIPSLARIDADDKLIVLRQLLNNYNHLKNTNISAPIAIEDRVRNELRNLGYRI